MTLIDAASRLLPIEDFSNGIGMEPGPRVETVG